jgi:hypothetical protein
MRPEMAKQQQRDPIRIENDPDPSENRVHAALFAFASFCIGNCSDIP